MLLELLARGIRTQGGSGQLQVELVLGFGARRADGRLDATLDAERDQVPRAAVRLGEKGPVAVLVPVIVDLQHGAAADGSGRPVTERLLDLANVGRASGALHHRGAHGVGVVAEALVSVDQVVVDGLPARGQIGGELSQHDRRARGVLVAHQRGQHEAVALLGREDEVVKRGGQVPEPPGPLQGSEHVGDVLEADQEVAEHHAVPSFHKLADQVGGDLGLDRQRAGGQPPGGRQGVQSVPREDRGELVAGQEAVAVAVQRSAAEAVGVGIGGEDEVRAGPGRERDAALQRLRDFRVRAAKLDMAEVAAHLALVVDVVQLASRLEAHGLQRAPHSARAGSMQACEHDDGPAGLAPQPEAEVHLDKCLPRRVRHRAEQVRLAGPPDPVEAHLLDPLDDRGQLLVVRGDLLAALAVVELAPVVVRMIVRGADVEAAVRAEPADQERQLRRGEVVLAVLGQAVDLHARGAVHGGGRPREVSRAQA